MLDKNILFDHFLKISSDILILFDSEFYIHETSEEAKKIFCSNKENLSEKNLIKFFKNLKINDLFFKNLKKVMKDNEGNNLPRTIFSSKNKKYIINWEINTLSKNHFENKLFLLKGTNATEKYELHEKIQELNYIFSNLPGVVFWKDKNLNYKDFNKNFIELTGFSDREQIVGKNDFDFSWRDQAESFRKDDIEVMLSGNPKIDVDDLIYLSNGTVLNVISNKSPLKDKKGNVIGILGVSVDITGRKQYEKSLQKKIEEEKISNLSQAQTLQEINKELMGFDIGLNKPEKIKQLLIFLRTIVANMPGNVYWKDLNSVYLGGNDNVVKICNLSSRAAIAGITDIELERKLQWQPGTAARFRQDDIEVINSKKPKTFEDTFVQADSKKVIMLTTKTPIFDDHRNVIGIIATSLDISQLKQQELELQQAKEKAELASQLKTDFMENMQHDMRTPAAGIYGVLDMLRHEKWTEEYSELLSIAASSAKELLVLCNDVIDFENIDYGHRHLALEDISIYNIAHHIIDLNSSTAKHKGIDLLLEFDKNLPQIVKGDAYRLKKILTNLVGNSLKFTQAGQIKLTVEQINGDKDKITVQFKINDTGIGIPKDKQNLIFDKFTRLTPSNQGLYKGFGLGLSFVKKFVDELNGKIEIASEVNIGTTFYITLPFAISDATEITADDEESEHNVISSHDLHISTQPVALSSAKKFTELAKDISKTGIHVLLIEDDKLARFAAINHFERKGAVVTVAETVSQSKELLDTIKFNFIVSDLGLPDGTGLDIVAYVKQNQYAINYATPFVALTAHSNDEKKLQAKTAGFLDILNKPLTAEMTDNLLKTYTRNIIDKPSNNKVAEEEKKDHDLIIDLAASMKIIGGTKEMAFEMLALLANSLAKDKPLLQSAYEKNDIKQTRELLHKIEGGLHYCGAPRLLKITHQLHDQVREIAQLSSLKPIYAKFYQEIDNVIEAFERVKTEIHEN